jgi:C4-dicarboxylate-binding protein DctP
MGRARCLCVLAAFLAVVPLAARADQIKLRVTLQLPKKSHIAVSLARLKAEVEQRAEGAVAFEIYDNSTLYSDEEVIGAVSSGAIEMGITNYNQYSKRPAIDIIGQPFLLTSARWYGGHPSGQGDQKASRQGGSGGDRHTWRGA